MNLWESVWAEALISSSKAVKLGCSGQRGLAGSVTRRAVRLALSLPPTGVGPDNANEIQEGQTS